MIAEIASPASLAIPQTSSCPRSTRLSIVGVTLLSVVAAGLCGCGQVEPAEATPDVEETASRQQLLSNPSNLAEGRPTAQSSIAHGGVPGRAVDGNAAGFWNSNSVTHTNVENQPWWQVDLQSVQSIGAIRIYNRTDCCVDRLTNFVVMVSDNGWVWQSFPFSGTVNGQATLAIGRSARYVRVQLAGNGILSLAEVQVFPPAPQFPPSQWYHLVSFENGRLIEGGASAAIWDFTGLSRQSWRFIPTASGYYELQSRENGNLLTDGSSWVPLPYGLPPSLSRWVGMAAGTNPSRQDFRFIDVGNGLYNVLSPWNAEVLEGGGSVAVWPFTGYQRQYFRVMPAEPSRTDASRYIALRAGLPDSSIPSPPDLTAFMQPPDETAPVLIGDTPIPFMNVKGDRGPATQVQVTPYYRLSRYGFWRLAFYHEFSGVATASASETIQTGYIKQSSLTIENSTSMTVTGGGSFTFGGLSANLSLTVSRDLKTIESTSTTSSSTETYTVTRTVPTSPYKTAFAVYVRGDRYVLESADGMPISSWFYLDKYKTAERTLQQAR